MQATLMIFLLFALLISDTFATDYCKSSECKAERRQSFISKGYEHEVSKYKKMLAQSSCSACNIDGTTPCYNNGTCVVTGPYAYRCDCPDNTTGDHCETILSCVDENPCGKNAICTVFNHKKTCSCPPGYTGDENVECTLRSKQARLSGDPHYTTFDGSTFDYMGTCPYTLMKACNASVDFSITSTNFILSPQNYMTYVRDFVLKTQGHEFRVDQNLNYYIDGQLSFYPNYWPTKDTATITATKPSTQVIITDSVTQAVITFSDHTLSVTVPLTPFFYGPNTMCGVFGSIDDQCGNDIRARNGTTLPTSSCAIGTNATVVSYQDTWVTNSTSENCIEGEVISNITSCDLPSSQQQCNFIRQAIDGLGPFGACQAMGHDVVDKLYHDCTYDICTAHAQCDTLDVFAQLCITTLPFVNIDNWRTPSFCPFPCPPNSRYSLRTPTCQNTCADPNYSNSSTCHEGSQEGCICEPGFYFDPNGDVEGFKFVCRPLDDCGCMSGNGSYYPPNTHWLDANCTIATQCFEGQLTSEAVACSDHGQCNNVGGSPTCQCLPGYNGDGFNCTDIDECMDSSVCNVNSHQGACINLPGTYQCTCFAPYSGPECTEYTPSRHCADLQLFHGKNKSGVYSVSIGADYGIELTNAQLNWTEVYCDLESVGGGWTLMAHGNNTGGKTFAEYAAGFGDPSIQRVWLGLENLHAMTESSPTSLRVIVESCPEVNVPVEDCTYDYFSVTDSAQQYSVFLNSTCQSTAPTNGTTNNSRDGWITWDRAQLGPKFVTFDMGDTQSCSDTYYNTGWWYDGSKRGMQCGIANLNGLHFGCGGDEYQYMGAYLMWRNFPVKDAHMYLRPKGFPFYDAHYAN